MAKISSIDYIYKKVQQVKPSMAYNGNLTQWQPAAKEKLAELLGLDCFTKVDPQTHMEYETKIDGATEIRFEFYSEEGFAIPCHLLLPDGIEKPPVMICLQGHSSGMHISMDRDKFSRDHYFKKYSAQFCLHALKNGFAAIAMEQRNFGELSGDPDGMTLCQNESGIAAMIGRTTIGERVWDVQRLIDVIEKDFADRVDIHSICLMGNSGGGTATAYTAVFEDRLKLVMPSCAMASYKDSIGAMPHCACNYVPHIAKYFDMGDIMAMAYPRLFVQVSGDEDPIFPLFAAKAVYEQGSRAYADQGGSNRCTLVVGHGGHAFYPDEAYPEVHRLLKEEN